ncbi:hypothetical protein [Moraxella bovis]|uniref:Uncharacterized protein n=1 Tax=Moraxella bovis TaxID=476 RepID=A0ABY6M2Y6_MORBO|nr:hypothetical protein [Moraxella bovis]UZA02083.1 hypothetical protein LP092_08735 [Moraxella bovis]UZA36478.1 hypothetical protein LP098_05790 [Moraxella bovis]
MISINYIGKKPFFDRLYNTGLTFDVGQVRDVPDDMARLFLRHKDLFAVSDTAQKAPKKETDNTQALIDQQAKETAEKTKNENNLQELYTQVSVMDKDALEQFAKDHYQIDLNKRKSLENLREEVIGLIDQFGVV